MSDEIRQAMIDAGVLKPGTTVLTPARASGARVLRLDDRGRAAVREPHQNIPEWLRQTRARRRVKRGR